MIVGRVGRACVARYADCVPRGQMDPSKRAEVTAAGGRARWAGMSPDEKAELRRAGAAAVNSPLGLAIRIRKQIAGLDEATRAQLRAELESLLLEIGDPR